MIGEIFNFILLRPILNLLLLLYSVLGQNYALALVLLTVGLRLLTQPLMSSQLKMTKKMNELQPQLNELQKKYANDKERLAQEQMKLYKEQGINPMGGCLPMLAQFPIWIALYNAINLTLGRTPLQLLALSKHVYSFGIFAGLQTLVPLASKFLWLDLGVPDPYYIIPILTAATMWLSQKLMTPSTPKEGGDQTQAQLGNSMQMMMPLMFGFITVNVASGLGLYFIISNLVGIAVQYFSMNQGSLRNLLPWRATTAPVAQPSASVERGTKSGSRKSKKR